ncbi:hypothetical protein [Subtercola sp. YIM 133946]|uniref:hypothetical protein n=1 Tax=Subtercola sp. YIM 133946 TaxID=3118909 RepID=UPI002F95397F
MSIRLITLSGCDDRTKALVDLSDEQAELVGKVLNAVSTASQYSCQPRGSIVSDVPEPDEDDEPIVEVTL